MAKPKNIIRPVEKSISIPENLVLKIDLLLWSELENRVPHGAWSRFISGLITNELERLKLLEQNDDN